MSLSAGAVTLRALLPPSAVLSHFRRENETQVYLPKSQSTMTRADKGQSMPKKLRYIAGLRGGSKTKMAVVQLELELGQPHQH